MHPFNTLYQDDIGLFASKLEVISEGHDWTEGPVWDFQNKVLYFSDTNEDKIFRWTKENGSELFLNHSGGFIPNDLENSAPEDFLEILKMPGSNGLAIRDGYLYMCQHMMGRIARIKLDQIKSGTSLSDYF